MQKWEYLTIVFGNVSEKGKIIPVVTDPELITYQTNWYAQQGWELVSQFPTTSDVIGLGGGASKTNAIFATFKRRMEEQA